jgi:hypothetical protein
MDSGRGSTGWRRASERRSGCPERMKVGLRVEELPSFVEAERSVY